MGFNTFLKQRMRKEPMGVLDHPFIRMQRMQWRYSGKRKWVVVVFTLMFLGSNALELLNPYIIGTLFNVIQLQGASPDFLSQVFFWISLLLVFNVAFWCLHGPARVLERTNAYLVKKNYQVNPD